VLKLKAESSEERDHWVQVVKNILRDSVDKEQKLQAEAEAAAQLVIQNSLFEDCEPSWTPNQRDVAILLRLEKQVIPERKTSSPTKNGSGEVDEEGGKRRGTMTDIDQSICEGVNDVSRSPEKKKSTIKKLFKLF